MTTRENRREYHRKYYLANREKILAKNSKWFNENPGKGDVYNRKWRKNNLERELKRNRIKARHWRKKNPNKYLSRYGLTIVDYDRMLSEQSGTCAICRQGNSAIRFHVDHCHETGIVRGLLCKNCNLALGFFRDRQSVLISALEYLRKQRVASNIVPYQSEGHV